MMCETLSDYILRAVVVAQMLMPRDDDAGCLVIVDRTCTPEILRGRSRLLCSYNDDDDVSALFARCLYM